MKDLHLERKKCNDSVDFLVIVILNEFIWREEDYRSFKKEFQNAIDNSEKNVLVNCLLLGCIEDYLDGLFVWFTKNLRAKGGEVFLVLPENAMSYYKLCNFDSFFKCYSTVEEAENAIFAFNSQK